MESRRVLATLCAWCTLNGIEIDSRLRFNWDPNAGCGIFSRSYIPANTTLVRIPKHAVLSTKSCTLASCIPTSLYGRGAQLALSLAVYIEILKGKFSRWSGYLQSVPRDIVDIPVFWNSGTGAGKMSCHRQKDGTEALHWLRGTEVAKILTVGDDNKPVIDEMRNYYHEVAQPLIFRHKSEITRQLDIAPTLHDFYRAHALVSSRAFVVDAYHGLCMVPVADAFNHESPHNVHLESDYYVCAECGSLHECCHDRADSVMAPATNFIKSTPRVVANEDEQEDDYEMVSVTVIPPGTEVFNTYGETLTNAQLLTQYGFILDANENDVLTWDIEQVLESISPGADERMLVHDVSNIVLTWRRLCQKNWNLASGSGLLYMADTETGWGYSLTLDGDGKISYPLWIIVALLSLSRTDAFSSVEDSQSVLIHLRSLLDVQCLAESHLGTEEELEDIAINLNIYERTLLQELKQVCQLMIRLCTDRKSKTGHIGFSAMGSDVGKYFDALSDDRPRTKMALSIVLSELSILNNCQATWSELEHIIVRA